MQSVGARPLGNGKGEQTNQCFLLDRVGNPSGRDDVCRIKHTHTGSQSCQPYARLTSHRAMKMMDSRRCFSPLWFTAP